MDRREVDVTEGAKGQPRVLIADDQQDVLESLRLLLKPEGYRVELVTTPAAALAAVESREFDVALIDLNFTRDTTSGREGLDLLGQLQATDGTLPVVVMTAWGSVELAVEAVRRGARDFIQKPWENERLLAILRTQAELARALRRGQRLEAENRLLRAQERPTFIAESRSMQPVLQLISKVGPSDANVLITGEHGTGKDVVAGLLHAESARASRPLIVVNVGGLSEGVFASELFGHVKGAYTDAKGDRVGRFEMADGGTLFLDEIANVPLGQQAKLLRVLETGELERVGSSKTQRVSVRVLSATNADLEAEVQSGAFRADLLFRLNTIRIHLPPMRERLEDIPVLAMHFLGRFAQRYRKSLTSFDAASMDALKRHPWPGNVRELAHVVERAVLMAEGDTIRVDDLGLQTPEAGTGPALEHLSLDEVERVLVTKALERHDGNVSRAAKDLGLSRSALYRRLEKFDL
jgi:DNA-binding NtrC family response regulator